MGKGGRRKVAENHPWKNSDICKKKDLGTRACRRKEDIASILQKEKTNRSGRDFLTGRFMRSREIMDNTTLSER